MTSARIHGGGDSLGVPSFDFSSNSNSCGPCPQALNAVQQANVCVYPDADYIDLRAQLAAFHGVSVGRMVLAGSASEFIMRMTAAVVRSAGAAGATKVSLPKHAYGDYQHAAKAWGLALAERPDSAQLVWACEPSSPLGQAHTGWPLDLAQQVLVLDGAYAQLRLSGKPSLNVAQLNQVWQLYTPNKALGLTGVRAAYVIAPKAMQTSTQGHIDQLVCHLNQLAPSWPVGAHGVAMLQAWVSPPVQAWLANCVPLLRQWKARQIAMLESLGWQLLPSEANFFCAKPLQPVDLQWLRENHGIKLRDASSFGLPGWLRLGVLQPSAQDALQMALRQ
jgi:histidinol-phosphate aminotransferase